MAPNEDPFHAETISELWSCSLIPFRSVESVMQRPAQQRHGSASSSINPRTSGFGVFVRASRPTVLRDDPAANVMGAVHDSNSRCLNPRKKLHRFPTNQGDVLQIEEDATMCLDVQQLLQPLRMFMVQFSAEGEDDRVGFC